MVENGDKGTKFFFNFLKKKEAKESVGSIKEGDKLITEQEDILSAFSHYYKTLFTSEDLGMNIEAHNVCALIPKRIEEEDAKMLDKDITLGEIAMAIRALKLKKDKDPGLVDY